VQILTGIGPNATLHHEHGNLEKKTKNLVNINR